uniref:Uncharacterized protein n=1 Tax=Peronospora matthiolae TaxID=2874970 RepID=A0AAV1UD51_9STRA
MIVDALGSPEQNPAAYPALAPAPDDGVSMFASLATPRGQAPPQQRVLAQAAALAASGRDRIHLDPDCKPAKFGDPKVRRDRAQPRAQ